MEVTSGNNVQSVATRRRFRRLFLTGTVLLAIAVGFHQLLTFWPLLDEATIRKFAELALNGYFWFCIVGTLVPMLLFMVLRIPVKTSIQTPRNLPLVSIIIPAFNEEAKIAQAINAATKQDYPRFEVIFVDDGSDDFTKFIAQSFNVRSIVLPRNAGKHAALNAGIAAAAGSIIVTTDSDSLLEPDALRHIVPHFDDPAVGAVAGMIQPISINGWVRRFQAIEYRWGQEILKFAQVGSGTSVTVCPGPVSAFRRPALEAIGGFKARTVTEDFDISLELIDAGHVVAFEPRAVALTDTPKSWSALSQQRLRWYRGTLQTLWQHRSMFFKRTLGITGLFWLPYFAFAGYGSIVIDLAAITIIPGLVMMSDAAWDLVRRGLIFILVIESFVVAQYVFALITSGETRARMYAAALLIKPFNMFLAWARVRAMLGELRRAERIW